MNKFLSALLYSIIIATTSFAQQEVTLSGFVIEENSQEKLPGAIIKIDQPETYISTNEYGYYSITLSPGTYKITAIFPGSVDTSFTVSLSQDTRKDLPLKSKNELSEVVVYSTANEVEQVRMSTHNLDIDQIKSLPSLMGEKDVFKALKLLPGVQKGQEGSSGFNVRGGGTDQNLIILDDAVVYNASHLFGFFSTFNGDALKGVELIKGGYPAKYGERLSSVLNMTMKDGDKQKYKGEYGIGLISSRATFEGPIKKDVSSFLISGRRTYADILMQPFLMSMDEDISTGYYFYDLNAKVNYKINDNNDIFLSGYFGRDRFYLREKYDNESFKTHFGWGNATGTLRWNHVFSPKLFSNLTVNYSNYNMQIGMTEKYNNEIYNMKYLSAIDDIGAKYDLSYYWKNNNTIRFGYKFTRHYFRPSVYTEKENDSTIYANNPKTYVSYENNLYIDDEWKATKNLAMNLGLRGSSFTSEEKTYWNIEPRVSARYLINPLTSVKASYTIMNQYMHLLSSTGINLPTDLWIPATSKIKPQRATQYSFGIFKDIANPNLSISLEGYYKDMKDIVSYKEGASFLIIEDPTDPDAQSINFENNVTSGIGKSYGAELMVQKQKGRFNGWLSYTLSWTKFKIDDVNDGNWFYPNYDRRHDLSIVGFYQLTPKIKLNALFTMATGNPVNLPSYSANYVQNVAPNGNLGNNGYVYGITQYNRRNEYRAETYHRMDVGIQFLKQKKRGIRTWEISCYNVYNRMNPFFYNLESSYNPPYENNVYKYTIFPIIPSITYSFKFL